MYVSAFKPINMTGAKKKHTPWLKEIVFLARDRWINDFNI